VDRIDEVTKDTLDGIIQIRQLDPSARPQPELLHQRMRTFLERAMRRATELGFSAQDSQDIGYALAALSDETALARPGELRDYWQRRTLQLAFFNENVAGENFFQRLQSMIGDPGRAEVLRVYYVCLLLGFQGKYRVRGGEIELASITERCASSLRAASASTVLSPSGARPRDAGGGVRRALPLIGASIAAVVASLVLYTALRVSLSSSASDVAQHIASLVSG
jgi:type VI secretion system protein ImpK